MKTISSLIIHQSNQNLSPLIGNTESEHPPIDICGSLWKCINHKQHSKLNACGIIMGKVKETSSAVVHTNCYCINSNCCICITNFLPKLKHSSK